MKKRLLLWIAALLLISFQSINAQEDTFSEESKLQISGFADIYYQYNFNDNSPGLTSFTETHNSFTLGMVNLAFSHEIGDVGMVADLAWGPRADIANGFTGSSLNAIKQLYITYSPGEIITFSAGTFSTHIGYEVIDATGNFNYSTSYLFSNGPFYHTGIKADIELNENLGFMVGIFNETDSKFDFDNGKHVGAQISYTAGGLSSYINFLGGPDDGIDGTGNKGFQFDLTGTYQLNPELMIGVNATSKVITYNTEESTGNEISNDSWQGGALYLNYSINESFGIGIRGEYFDDPDGINIFEPSIYNDGGNVFDFTLSSNIKTGPLTFIPEFRIDRASEDIFIDKDGNITDISPSVLGAIIYSF